MSIAMNKISNSKIAQVLSDTQKVLLSVTAERDKLASENAVMYRRMEAEKLATAMHDKGIRLEVGRDQLIGDLEKAAEDGRFSVIQEAVDMVAPNMGLSGTLSSDEATSGGSTSLESFILGNVG
jgi:hypothetical protein